MILYNLKCSQSHNFEAWFKDGQAFDKQAKRGDIECPICSDNSIQKAIMAPRLSSATRKKGLEHESSNRTGTEANRSNLKINSKRATKLAKEIMEVADKIQKHVEENCENVGENFAEEARAIHYGEARERGIYGEATTSEVEDLVEENIPISRIPWKKNKPS